MQVGVSFISDAVFHIPLYEKYFSSKLFDLVHFVEAQNILCIHL
jgi:hypothetical protein